MAAGYLNQVSLLSVTVIASALSDSTGITGPKDARSVATHAPLKTVTLFNAGNYLMLECELNGKSAYFMVDTGASFTVLHSKFARLYSYQVLERKGQQTTGFGGNQSTVEIAIGANLNIGDREISMGYLSQDLTKMIRLIQQQSNVRIAGIIGTDLLKRLGCSVDLGNKVLSF